MRYIFYLFIALIPNISWAQQQDTLFFKDNTTGEVVPVIKKVYDGNYPMTIDGVDCIGNCRYEYVVFPSEENRVYHGTFKFQTNRVKPIGKDRPYSLSGNFNLDGKNGEWLEEYIGYGDDNGLGFSNNIGKHITKSYMQNGKLNGPFEYEFIETEGNVKRLHIMCQFKDNRLVDSLQITRFYTDGQKKLYAYFNEHGKADGLWKCKVILNNGVSYVTHEWQYNRGMLETIKNKNNQTGEVVTKNIGLYESGNSNIQFPTDFAIENFEKIASMGYRFRKGQDFRIVHPFTKE